MKRLTKKQGAIILSLLLFFVTFLLLQYSPLNQLHGRSDAPVIAGIFVIGALILALPFRFKVTYDKV